VHWGRKLARAVLAAVVLFAGTYALAWFNSYNLSRTYYRQAEASYRAGRYIEALMGYKGYDQAHKRRVFVGGYAQVVNIWEHPWALPRPAIYEEARAKVMEIIHQKFTRQDAQLFLDRYLGRENPYLGEVMLRMAKLYEQEGDDESALEVYHLITESFRADRALVERAKERAAALERKKE